MLFQPQHLGLFRRIEAAKLQRLDAGSAVALIGRAPFQQLQIVETVHLIEGTLRLQIARQRRGELHNPSKS